MLSAQYEKEANPLRDQLNFDNTFARLSPEFYTKQQAKPLATPHMAAFSESAAKLLDMTDTQYCREELTAICSGNASWIGAEPLAMVYSGHQFGIYNPQLGDGRGLLLGEVRNQNGQKWDLHLKGAGQTPYSRFGDGRAVLRSCIREFLCSEAMYHLNIPTTRALCVITSDTPIYRETKESGATLLRLATTHIRFGHFEYFSYTNQLDALKTLTDYTIQHYYPHLVTKDNRYELFFEEVLDKTARLIALWQANGFAHGVMNTDNMSILGETIDYGPFGFMDDFDWNYICNHSDHQGRYAFSQQPDISYWNCGRLGSALLPLFENSKAVQKALDSYPFKYSSHYQQLMNQKLGLTTAEEEDATLISELLNGLQSSGCDYTLFFRQLCDFIPGQSDSTLQRLNTDSKIKVWLERYSERLKRNLLDDKHRCQQMKQINPKFILRGYLAQQAIEQAEKSQFTEIERLMTVLESPFCEHPELDIYAAPTPDWGKKLSVSCSS